jgi:hypothetical protein
MNIFIKAYKIESALYVHAPLDFKFLRYNVEEKNKCKDFACFHEKFSLILKIVPEAAHHNFCDFPLCHCLFLQGVPPNWMQENFS